MDESLGAGHIVTKRRAAPRLQKRFHRQLPSDIGDIFLNAANCRQPAKTVTHTEKASLHVYPSVGIVSLRAILRLSAKVLSDRLFGISSAYGGVLSAN